MAHTLTKEFAIISEGGADSAFLTKLFEEYEINDFDIIPDGVGFGGIGGVLLGLSGDPVGYQRLKGIIILVDAGDKPQKTYKEVCKMLQNNGPFDSTTRFVKPVSPFKVAQQPDGHPAIAIMHLPLDGPGALETVCLKAVCEELPWIDECVTSFLSCGSGSALQWSAEKRDKARLQCMIAALNEQDPSKALRYVLESGLSLLPMKSIAMKEIATEIIRLRSEMELL